MGLRRRECRASVASVSKTRSFEVWGGWEEETLQNRFSGVGGPLREGLKTTALNTATQPQPEECSSEQGPKRGMAPRSGDGGSHKGTT